MAEEKLGKRLLQGLQQAAQAVARLRVQTGKLNLRMKSAYYQAALAAGATALAGLLAVLLLFVPPYVGLADDGSHQTMLQRAGISAPVGQQGFPDYFIRQYGYGVLAPAQQGTGSLAAVLLALAKGISRIFSQSEGFDIRFLALVHLAVFLPLFYQLVRLGVGLAGRFAEGVAAAALAVFLFADVSYLAFFSSFYATAPLYLCLIGCVVCGVRSHGQKGFASLLGYTLFGCALVLLQGSLWLCGFVLAGYCVYQAYEAKGLVWRTFCGICGAFLCLCGLYALSRGAPEFGLHSRYNAMTRGVLLQSAYPANTLQELGMAPEYEVLADTNSFAEYPLVAADSPVLADFYAGYSAKSIAAHYLRHPAAFAGMLDLSVKAAMQPRQGYGGNFEQAVGLPVGAKSLFWSGWSNFKLRSAPKTLAFVVLLGASAAWLLVQQKQAKMAWMLSLLLLAGFAQAGVAIVKSGDAQLLRHTFVLTASLDLLVYFSAVALLVRLNILSRKEDAA